MTMKRPQRVGDTEKEEAPRIRAGHGTCLGAVSDGIASRDLFSAPLSLRRFFVVMFLAASQSPVFAQVPAAGFHHVHLKLH